MLATNQHHLDTMLLRRFVHTLDSKIKVVAWELIEPAVALLFLQLHLVDD